MKKMYRLLPLALLLALAACNKKSEEAAPAAAPPANNVAVAPQSSDTPLDTSSGNDAPLAGEVLSVDEPMPPVDEGGAPPQVLARSQFAAVDAKAAVSGDMAIYQADDGSRLLRLENLKTSEGSSGVVLAFVHSAAPKTAADVQGHLDVGALKGPAGNMNYLLERKLDLKDQHALALITQGDTPSVIGYAPLDKPR